MQVASTPKDPAHEALLDLLGVGESPCGACHGTGMVEGQRCTVCGGTGRVFQCLRGG